MPIDHPFVPLGAVEIHTNPMLPETAPFAADDFEERLAAMTAHHLDLSLIPLTEEQPAMWHIGGRFFCHPNSLARLRAAIAVATAQETTNGE